MSCKDLHHGTGKSSLHLAQMSSFACQISRVGRSERQIHLSNRKRGSQMVIRRTIDGEECFEAVSSLT